MRSDPLTVWLSDVSVGELAREGRRYDLRFHQRAGVAGALTVAVAGAADLWTPSFTRAWFDGLLPEESRRSAAEADHEVTPWRHVRSAPSQPGWSACAAASDPPPGC